MDHSKISQVVNGAVHALGSAKDFTAEHVAAHAAFLSRGEHPSVATIHAEMEPGSPSFAELSAQNQLALKVFHAVVTVLAREADLAEPVAEPVAEEKQPESEAPAAEAIPTEAAI